MAPATFELTGINGDGSSRFVSPHELHNEVVLTFPPGYFAGRPIPLSLVVESFVLHEGPRGIHYELHTTEE